MNGLQTVINNHLVKEYIKNGDYERLSALVSMPMNFPYQEELINSITSELTLNTRCFKNNLKNKNMNVFNIKFLKSFLRFCSDALDMSKTDAIISKIILNVISLMNDKNEDDDSCKIYLNDEVAYLYKYKNKISRLDFAVSYKFLNIITYNSTFKLAYKIFNIYKSFEYNDILDINFENIREDKALIFLLINFNNLNHSQFCDIISIFKSKIKLIVLSKSKESFKFVHSMIKSISASHNLSQNQEIMLHMKNFIKGYKLFLNGKNDTFSFLDNFIFAHCNKWEIQNFKFNGEVGNKELFLLLEQKNAICKKFSRDIFTLLI